MLMQTRRDTVSRTSSLLNPQSLMNQGQTGKDLLGQGGIAMITGAAGGIGRAVATALGRRGHPVWLVDIDNAALLAACEALRVEGLDVTPRPCDFSYMNALDCTRESS